MAVIFRASTLPGHTERLTGETAADDICTEVCNLRPKPLPLIRLALISARRFSTDSGDSFRFIRLASAVGQSVGKRLDVVVNRDIWPVLSQDGSAVWVDFAEGDCPHSGSLEAN